MGVDADRVTATTTLTHILTTTFEASNPSKPVERHRRNGLEQFERYREQSHAVRCQGWRAEGPEWYG